MLMMLVGAELKASSCSQCSFWQGWFASGGGVVPLAKDQLLLMMLVWVPPTKGQLMLIMLVCGG